jgi:hypothetical protein
MAVEFTRRLKGVVDGAVHGSRAELRFGLGMLADIILESLETFESGLPSVRVDHASASQAAAIARGAVRVLDACHLLESSLLSTPAASSASISTPYRCKELELPRRRDHDTLLAFLRQRVLRTVEWHPVVYVVWTQDPERYLHVGRSPHDNVGVQSLELDARGELFAALQQGSVITLLVPSSPSATLVDLERALVRVLHCQSALPEVDARPEQVPGATSAAYLAELGRLLGELAV